MDTQQPYYGKGLITILSFFFHLFYYLLIAITIITIIFMAYCFLQVGNQTGFAAPINFQVFFSITDEIGKANWNSDTPSIFPIAYAMGTAQISHVPYGFMVIFCLMSIALFILISLSIRLTIQILKTIKQKSFLLLENASRMRWIARLGIVTLIIDKLSTIITSNYLKDQIEFSGIKFNTVNMYTFINSESIFSYLFLLVIAEVFRIGAKLQEEQNLTI